MLYSVVSIPSHGSTGEGQSPRRGAPEQKAGMGSGLAVDFNRDYPAAGE